MSVTVAELPTLSREDLQTLATQTQAAYQQLLDQGLKLDLTRGKPSDAQLDLAEAMLRLPVGHLDASGTDVRNYGGLAGLTELRAIFAELLGLETAQLIAGGNSSLTLMHDALAYCLLHGAVDSAGPWSSQGPLKFLCPVPGYDRHFALTQSLGFELISVPMTDDGPDPDAVAALVKDDPAIKGIWIVPTYANPTGAVCTLEVAARLAAMPTAAPDFKIFWDNAYGLHHLTSVETKSADIVSLAAASGHPHRPILFASTSKITFAGAGVAFLGGSVETIAWYLGHLGFSSIGPDKVNHLRHVQFFQDADGVRAHMAKHREVIAPKFAEVERVLSQRLGPLGIATWTKPQGGYFVSLDVPEGTAARVVALAKKAGIALTPAGSSYPYGIDPDDKNIRLAPTMPPLEDVSAAMEGVATCAVLAAVEKLLG